MGLLCAEQHVGNLRKWTFENSGTPVRRTKRQKSQNMNFQELWDSCAQNKTSEIPTKCTSHNSGTPVRKQNVRNIKKCTLRNSGIPVRRAKRRISQKSDFQEFWDSCAQKKTSEISKTALSGSPDRYRCSCTAAQASGDQCSADDGGRPES